MARSKGNGLISTVLTAVVASGVTMFASDYVKQHSGSATPAITEDKVKEIVGSFLAENPKAIIDALQNWQVKEQANRVKKQQDAVASLKGEFEKNGSFPVVGNPSGDATVIEFYDYNCPACKAMYESLDALLKEDKNVRVVFAEFPIFGPQSDTNAKLALAIHKLAPEKYFDFHSAMMRFKGKADESYALTVAKTLGLNPDVVKKESGKPEYEEHLNHVRELAKKLDIRGTPAVIVNGILFNGALPFNDLKAQVGFARGEKKPTDKPASGDAKPADDAKPAGDVAPAAPATEGAAQPEATTPAEE